MELRIHTKRYYEMLLVLSFLFLMLSKSLAGTFVSTLFSLGLIVLLFFNLLGAQTLRFRLQAFHLLFWFYLALFFTSIIRQYAKTDLSLAGAINVLLFFFSLILIQWVAVQRIKPDLFSVAKLLYIVLNSYITLNLALYVLGFVKGRYPGVNALLGLFGIHIDRVFFIFAPSLAYFAMISGVGVLISLFLYLRDRRTVYVVSLILCLTALILTDSRGPIFGLAVLLILIFPARRFWLRNQLLFFLFFIFSVTLFITTMYLIDSYLFDIDQFSRENSTLLSWRDVIWELFFENYKPSAIEFLFGYGNVGQKISGLSSNYQYLFANWPNPEEISLHNNSLQMLVDIGVVGIVSFYTVLYHVVKKAIRFYRSTGEVVILFIPAAINYILLMGFSDIVVNISNVGTYFILMFLMIAVLYYEGDYTRKQVET